MKRFSTARGLTTLLFSLVLLGLSFGSVAQTDKANILILGDSLSASYGIPLAQGWVSLLEQRLVQQGYGYRLVNASVSGETSGGGRARLAQLLTRHKPALVVLELGGNDALRGHRLAGIQENLAAMVEASQHSGAQVLLLGMRIPPNYGPRYSEGFFSGFAKVAEQTGAALVPFLLENIALKAGMLQADGIHPTAAAQPLIVDNVWSKLAELLE